VGVVFSAGAIATQKRKEGKNTPSSKTSKIVYSKPIYTIWASSLNIPEGRVI